jgi:hypothetical protein
MKIASCSFPLGPGWGALNAQSRCSAFLCSGEALNGFCSFQLNIPNTSINNPGIYILGKPLLIIYIHLLFLDVTTLLLFFSS